MSLLFSAQSWAVSIDGCYQMYTRGGGVYPSFCIKGSAEEGIAGAGTQVAIMGPNSNNVIWCAKTIKVEAGEAGEMVLKFNEKIDSIKLGVLSEKNEGQVVISEGSKGQPLDYMKISKDASGPLADVFESPLCQ